MYFYGNDSRNLTFYFRKTLTGLFPAALKLTSVEKKQGSISNAELAKAS